MLSWKLQGANALTKAELPLPVSGSGAIRVRITKVYANGVDYAICTGGIEAKKSVVPGRYAVGFVSEESGHPLFPKGTRVVPHVVRPAPEGGTEKRDFTADDFQICGRTIDGFLEDFVLLTPEQMTPLPASVSDENALFLHHVAFAKAIVDKLGAKKGQHIAVVGANLLGILVSQLLIYQQAAPILVDRNEARLAFARTCGIYYTMPADDSLLDAVASVTGGRLVSGAVYVAPADGGEPDIPFRLAARGADIVISASQQSKVVVDLDLAFRKELTVHCVENGSDYIETAINLIANKAVELSAFRIAVCDAQSADKLLLEKLARETVGELDVINLL